MKDRHANSEQLRKFDRVGGRVTLFFFHAISSSDTHWLDIQISEMSGF